VPLEVRSFNQWAVSSYFIHRAAHGGRRAIRRRLRLGFGDLLAWRADKEKEARRKRR
jgi:hypothetical protein